MGCVSEYALVYRKNNQSPELQLNYAARCPMHTDASAYSHTNTRAHMDKLKKLMYKLGEIEKPHRKEKGRPTKCTHTLFIK